MAMTNEDEATRYSIAEARDRLAAVVHEAEAGARVELTRRGKPVAILVSLEEYRRLSGRSPKGFWAAVERFRAEAGLDKAGLDDEVFDGLRDRSPGRDSAW